MKEDESLGEAKASTIEPPLIPRVDGALMSQ
jgi:hypothetical protein